MKPHSRIRKEETPLKILYTQDFCKNLYLSFQIYQKEYNMCPLYRIHVGRGIDKFIPSQVQTKHRKIKEKLHLFFVDYIICISPFQ